MESREGNWQEFEIWLQELQGREYRRGLLFRGQADSKWRLETTLERSGHSTMPIADYYDLIVRRIGPVVSAFSSMQAPSFNENLWNELSDYARLSDYRRYKGSIFDQTVFPGGDHFEYVAYLRHHGFPSPLLDWSQSPSPYRCLFRIPGCRPEDRKEIFFRILREAPGNQRRDH